MAVSMEENEALHNKCWGICWDIRQTHWLYMLLLDEYLFTIHASEKVIPRISNM